MKSGHSWKGQLAPGLDPGVSTSGSRPGQSCHSEGYLEWCCLLDGQTDFLSLTFFLYKTVFSSSFRVPAKASRRYRESQYSPAQHVHSPPRCPRPPPRGTFITVDEPETAFECSSPEMRNTWYTGSTQQENYDDGDYRKNILQTTNLIRC